MRLTDIVEALDPLSKWNQILLKLAANPPRDYFSGNEPEDPAEREAEHKRTRDGYLLVRKAVKYHAENFNGKRWPELERILLMDGWTDGPTLLKYLNSLTEEWPEGQTLLTNSPSTVHGTFDAAVDYMLKKNLRSSNLETFYKEMLTAKRIRRHLTDRMARFQEDLQTAKQQLAKLPPSGPIDPTGLDDQDEFQAHRIRLTVKQLENRIKAIQQALTASDEQLVQMVLINRPTAPAQREALGLPWAPTNLATYVDKWGIR